MDLPFAFLLDAFKYLKESGNKDKDKLSAYLDQTVSEIEKMKDIWEKNLTELRGFTGYLHSKVPRNGTLKIVSSKIASDASPINIDPRITTIIQGRNRSSYAMVAEQYRHASSVIKGRIEARERDRIIDSLGRFIDARNTLLHSYEFAIAKIKAGQFKREEDDLLVDLVEGDLNQMLEAAASFQVKVAAFRAS